MAWRWGRRRGERGRQRDTRVEDEDAVARTRSGRKDCVRLIFPNVVLTDEPEHGARCGGRRALSTSGMKGAVEEGGGCSQRNTFSPPFFLPMGTPDIYLFLRKLPSKLRYGPWIHTSLLFFFAFHHHRLPMYRREGEGEKKPWTMITYFFSPIFLQWVLWLLPIASFQRLPMHRR